MIKAFLFNLSVTVSVFKVAEQYTEVNQQMSWIGAFFFCAFNDNMIREGLVFGFDYVVVCEGLVLWVFFCCWAAG